MTDAIATIERKAALSRSRALAEHFLYHLGNKPFHFDRCCDELASQFVNLADKFIADEKQANPGN
jgi:hypothetical protein